MGDDRSEQVKKLLQQALELEPTQRATLLADARAKDPTLCEEVESLLAAQERSAADPLPPLEATITLIGDTKGGTSSRAESMQGQAVGSYRILREVGRGGMGVVYLAARADDQFKKHVAIKLLRRDMDTDDVVRRFRNERQILASIDHPNIGRLLDGGTTEDGRPYFLMEYIEGAPIDAYCDSHKLSVRERLELFRTVCSAVHFAHQNLVVHRDLKPGNILVSSDGVPRLLDFGIAKLLKPEYHTTVAGVTRQEERVMTPEYASPEQVRGEPITTASDVYSLGVLLYELLSGHHPYSSKGRAIHEISRAICEEDPRRPSTAIREVAERSRADGTTLKLTPELVSKTREGHPDKLRRCLEGDLDDIVMMAMRKEPQRRYASAEQLSDDIRRHLEGLPVMARKGTFAYNASKFIRRHRVGVAMALASAVFLIGVSVVLAVQSARIARARDRAESEAAKAQAVSTFLQETLRSADPFKGSGRDVTVLEVLEASADRIEESFADQPEVDAAIRSTIGSTYVGLGRHEEAEPWFREALEMRRELFGRDHPDVAESLHSLGIVLSERGDYEAAEDLLRESLALRRELRGNVDPDVAETLDDLAILLHLRGEHEESEQFFREALSVVRKLYGDKDPRLAEVMDDLAVLLADRGDYEEAEQFHREALGIRRDVLGNEHPDVATSLNNLAVLFIKQGNYEPAEQLHREALALRRKLLGNEHPHVAVSLNNVAYLLDKKKGAYEEAERFYREAMAIYRKELGEEHQQFTIVLRNLAGVIQAQGDLERAESVYLQAIALQRKIFDEQHPLLGATLSGYGICLTQMERYGEAEAFLLDSYGIMKAVFGPRHDWTHIVVENLIKLYEAWSKPEKAAEYRAMLEEDKDSEK